MLSSSLSYIMLLQTKRSKRLGDANHFNDIPQYYINMTNRIRHCDD